QTADSVRAVSATLSAYPGRSALQIVRYGQRHGRADGCARHRLGAYRRRVDGWHDRAGNRDLLSGACTLADIDHVDDRESTGPPTDPRGYRDPDGAAAKDQGRVRGALRPDLENPARRPLSGRRGTRSRTGRTHL